MSGRPVFQNQFEIRSWKRLNGGGPLGRFSAINGGPQSVLEDIKGRDGSVGSALLVSLIEHLGADATPDTLRVVVSKERVRDCMPSVKASMVMLDRGDVATAGELLAMSEPSQEVLHRSIALARILQRAGDMAGAREAAVRAYRADPSCPEAYEILSKVDPEGGWPQRRNISDVLAGRRPESPAGSGRVQGMYQIYYEWCRGNREAASDMLVQSPQYQAGDPEFLLASARMSVDERDWRSADMMFGRLPADRPAFVIREAAEAGEVDLILHGADHIRGADAAGLTMSEPLAFYDAAYILLGEEVLLPHSSAVLAEEETVYIICGQQSPVVSIIDHRHDCRAPALEDIHQQIERIRR